MSGYEDVDFIQENVILADAAYNANRDLRLEAGENPFGAANASTNPQLALFDERAPAPASGEVFRPDPAQSEYGGLCLSIDEGILHTATPAQIAMLHRIGREAIRNAIIDNREAFIEMILIEARQGRNYFDRFGDKSVDTGHHGPAEPLP